MEAEPAEDKDEQGPDARGKAVEDPAGQAEQPEHGRSEQEARA
jgi:hypothetical protein